MIVVSECLFILSLIFLNLNAIAANEFPEQSGCGLIFIKKSSSPIWEQITMRDSSFYFEVLTDVDQSIKKLNDKKSAAGGGDSVSLNGFKESYDDPTQFILSLGEGESNFIARRMFKTGSKTSYAVDAQQNDLFDSFKLEWPHNFQYTTFEAMNLIDEDGQRIQFGEIVSSYSLTYVLMFSDTIDTQLKALNKIFTHLRPGGHLRVWPYESISWAPLLKILKERKQIEGYKTFVTKKIYNPYSAKEDKDVNIPVLVIKK